MCVLGSSGLPGEVSSIFSVLFSVLFLFSFVASSVALNTLSSTLSSYSRSCVARNSLRHRKLSGRKALDREITEYKQ